jgi:tetratricopeptide (TPR) repeat protein
MFNHSLTAKRIFLNICLPALVVLFLSGSVLAATQDPDYQAERKRAFDLMDESKMTEALPILERLAARNANDAQVQFFLGFTIFARSREIKDPVLRKQERVRARSHLTRAKELGVTEPVLGQMLASIPADGSEAPKFSRNPQAEAAINEGEAAYVRGELDKAFDAYTRAYQNDPQLYEAALFAGDMKAKKGHNSTDAAERSALFDSAGEWFTKAIKIDPDRETAYRYWGDALLEYGKNDEALAKFIDALIAEPYNQMSYNGLSRWARRNQKEVGHPRIDVPSDVTSKKPGETTITIDQQTLKGGDDGSAAWLMYGMVRAAWMNKKDGSRSDQFARAYPNETTYRHSLAEELAAFQGVAESVTEQIKSKQVKKLTPSLENLMELHVAGLLEAYILFARPDKEIARDFAAYRRANRDKLRRYWLEVVIVK